MKLKFEVSGMTCAACSARVEKVTRGVPGVQDAQVNLMGGSMTVEAETDVKDAVIAAVSGAGYGACVAGEKAPAKVKEKSGLGSLIASGVFLLILMLIVTCLPSPGVCAYRSIHLFFFSSLFFSPL